MRISVFLTHPIVSSWNFSEEQRRRLQDRLPGAEVLRLESESSFRASLTEADIAIVWNFDETWLGDAPRLRWIVTPAAGRDYLRLSPRDGLDIDYASFHGPIIGETVIGMLLGHCRGLFLADRLRNDNPWPRKELARSMHTLQGARITILGFGAIGRWIGELAKPFGVQITGISSARHEPPAYFDAGDRVGAATAIDECLPQTDFLVVALPARRSTDRILDARRLALLPAHAVVVNVGRGNAIDEAALAAALCARELAGAYLDVYVEEPLPETSALRAAPNVLLFPHASAIAPKYLDLFMDEFARKYEARYGTAPRHRVSADR